MISIEHSRLLGLCVMTSVLCLAVPADAGRVSCPVCGQVFSDDTKVCPNDGTNLELLGKPVSGEAPSHPADDEDKEEKKSTAGAGGGAAGRYKRHDRGGGRKVVSDGPSKGYSDRRKRIVEDRRLPPEDEERSTQPVVKPHEREPIPEAEASEEVAPQVQQDATETLETRVHLSRQGAPLTSVGVRFFWLPEGRDPGTTSGAEIDLGLWREQLRIGLSSFFGVRFVTSRADVVFMEHMNLGYQYPARFSPYVIFQAGLGALATERFGVERVFFARSLGFELGVDTWVGDHLAVSPSLGFTRFVIDDAYWHSVTMKVSVGF